MWGWYCSYRIFVAVSKFRNLLQHALHKFAVFSRVAILAHFGFPSVLFVTVSRSWRIWPNDPICYYFSIYFRSQKVQGLFYTQEL